MLEQFTRILQNVCPLLIFTLSRCSHGVLVLVDAMHIRQAAGVPQNALKAVLGFTKRTRSIHKAYLKRASFAVMYYVWTVQWLWMSVGDALQLEWLPRRVWLGTTNWIRRRSRICSSAFSTSSEISQKACQHFMIIAVTLWQFGSMLASIYKVTLLWAWLVLEW